MKSAREGAYRLAYQCFAYLLRPAVRVRTNCANRLRTGPPPLGSPGGVAGVRVIRAVTIRYIWRWLAGWLLFRCLAPGFAGRALVLGNRPTGAGRFRLAGVRCGRAGWASSGRRNRKRGQAGKVRMKRKGGARITRDGAGAGENLTGVGVAPSVAPAIKPRAARAASSTRRGRRVRTDRVALPLVRCG